MKVPERLQPLVEEGIVQEVIRPLMSGKEAALFVVIAGGIQCVAKVYKDAQNRSFRHRAGYTEGRRVRNSRQQRAMAKGTKFGKESMETAWQSAEVDALFRLSAAGLRVPTPHLFSEGVLLMDLIVDESGEAAPRLWDVQFTPEQAVDLHQFLIREIVYMLCAGMVHGDLSEYNVLLAWDGPVIIDLPQATDAANNPNSRALFIRDVRNLTNFLATFAPDLAATRFGEEIWSLYERAMLHPDTPLTGRWKGSDKRADTRAVLGEIETAAMDARKKREFEGVDDRSRRGRSQASGPEKAVGQAKAAQAKPTQQRQPSPRQPAPQKPPSPKPARPAPSPAPAPTQAVTHLELDDLDDLLFVES